MKHSKNEDFNVLSLFDGMSCGQIALDQLGIEVDNYFACEIDKWAIKVALKNYPNTIQLGSVTDLHGVDMVLPKLGLIIGGSPCQGFSFAGKQLNFEDPRSMLFFEFVRILEEARQLNPDVLCMLENVRMKKEYLAVISEQLGVEPILINSALISAQNRQRVYWANWRVEQPEDKGILLADILEDDVHDSFYHTDKAVEYMNREGSTGRVKWSYLFHSEESKLKSQCVTANFFKGVPNNVLVCGRTVGRRINPNSGKRDDYNFEINAKQRFEARYDEKTGALTTVRKDNELGMNGIPVSIRKFTPIECERLQCVPDNYTNHVSNTQRYKMLGNGWTVDVIAHIFKGL